jgi:hypothetical protein
MRGTTRMRFLLLPIAVGSLTVAATTLPLVKREPARPLVLLVHGRGQFGFDSAAVRREWKRDLDSALTLVGMPKLRDEDVKLAWYADVLDPEADVSCGRPLGDEELGLGALARGFFASLTSALAEEGSDTHGARGLFGDLLYFLDSDTRCAAERRVVATLEDAARQRRPVIVVAYSLGSLVTYEVLRSRLPAASRPAELRLVTIGSPLGVREIRELVIEGQSLAVPAGVRSWENVYDPDDMFSAPLEGLRDSTFRNRATGSSSVEGAHQVGRYLRDRSTGAAVGRALCATQREQIVAACAELEGRGS